MPAPTYSERKSLYAKQWVSMVVEVPAPVEKAAKALLKSKARYQSVERGTGVPWFFIACIHWRESSGNFAGILHNGEKIIGTGRKTSLVPKGRGPFATWEGAAIDALSVSPHDMRNIKIDCVERFAYEAERWNGWGYALYHPNNPSAYLWSMSSVYKGGKYVADGKWDAKALDAQVGVMPLLKRLMELDPAVGFGGAVVTESSGSAGYVPTDVPAEFDPGIDVPSVVKPTHASPWGVLINFILSLFKR